MQPRTTRNTRNRISARIFRVVRGYGNALTADERGRTLIRKGVAEAWFAIGGPLRFVGGVFLPIQALTKAR
jgi:hypothetical protein